MVEGAPPSEMELINQELRRDAQDNFDALDNAEKKEGFFTEWLKISPLFMSMGIEFETHAEFLELYNSTTKQEI